MLSIGDDVSTSTTSDRIARRRGYPSTPSSHSKVSRGRRTKDVDFAYDDEELGIEETPRILWPALSTKRVGPSPDALLDKESSGQVVTIQDVMDYLRITLFSDDLYNSVGTTQQIVVRMSETQRVDINRIVAEKYNYLPQSWLNRQKWNELIIKVKEARRQDAVDGEDVYSYLRSVVYDPEMFIEAGVSQTVPSDTNEINANLTVARKFNYIDGFMQIKYFMYLLGRNIEHDELLKMSTDGNEYTDDEIGARVLMYLTRLHRPIHEYREREYPREYATHEPFKEMTGNYLLALRNKWIPKQYNRIFIEYLSTPDESFPPALGNSFMIKELIHGLRLMKPIKSPTGHVKGFEYNWTTQNMVKAWPANRANEALARKLITNKQFKGYIQSLDPAFRVLLSLDGKVEQIRFEKD